LRQQNIVAIAHPTLPIPAPLLPTEGDALRATFEIHGRQYQDTVVQERTLAVYRAPGLSIPAGLTSDGLPAGFEIDGLPGGTINCCASAWLSKPSLGRCPRQRSATLEKRASINSVNGAPQRS
jgi:Asp-tRNA(Asn)/Glu-tRNA(Gln) amidotransferase A subunit family amidase